MKKNQMYKKVTQIVTKELEAKKTEREDNFFMSLVFVILISVIVVVVFVINVGISHYVPSTKIPVQWYASYFSIVIVIMLWKAWRIRLISKNPTESQIEIKAEYLFQRLEKLEEISKDRDLTDRDYQSFPDLIFRSYDEMQDNMHALKIMLDYDYEEVEM